MSENVFEDKALQKYLNEIANLPTIPREKEHELAIKAKKGDKEAINKLIRGNLKFVVKIASRYQNRGLALSELISEGNMGLIKAIEKFDPEKDIKLISYAVWWIKQRILFALAEKTSLIRVPLGKSNNANKIKAIKEHMLTTTGKLPTLKEISKKADIKLKNVRSIELQSSDPLSLDDVSYSNKNDEVRLKDFIEDTSAIDPKTAYLNEKLMLKIEESFDTLTEREKFIVTNYFGLDDKKPQNFAQIAEKLDISRERVRQIQKEALGKILKGVSEELSNEINKFLV